MSSSHKKTHKQKRPRIINNKNIEHKVNDDDYVQMEVRGDGNCFYYSLYGAAKYHVDPEVFGKFLSCFGIENKPSLTPQEFAKKVRVKLAQEILKPDGIMEAQEAIAVERREPLQYQAQQNGNLFTMLREASMRIWEPTQTFEYRDLQRMLQVDEAELAAAKARYRAEGATSAEKRAATKNIAQAMRKVRRAKQNLVDILKPAGAREHWRNILDLVSREISEHPILKNARAYKTMTKEQFKDIFTKLLAGDKRDGNSFMYASQPDVELIKFFLSRCGTPLHIVTVNPRDHIMDSTNGVPILNVILLFRGGYEHYNYYVRGDKYRENEGHFEKPAVRVKRQHVAKGNTPETPKTPESLSSSNNSNSSLSSVSNSNFNSSLSPVSNSNSSKSSKTKKNSTQKAKNPQLLAAFAKLEEMRKAKEATSAQTKGNMNRLVEITKPAVNSSGFYIGPVDPKNPYKHVANALAKLPPPPARNTTRKAAASAGTNKTRNSSFRPRSASPATKALIAAMNNPPKPPSFRPRSASPATKALIAAMNNPPKPSAPPASPPRAKVAVQGKNLSPTTRKLYEQMIAPPKPAAPSTTAVAAPPAAAPSSQKSTTQKGILQSIKNAMTRKKNKPKNKKPKK